MVAKIKKPSKPTLRLSRVGAAKREYAKAQKNREDVLRSVRGIPGYALNNEQQRALALSDSKERNAKRNLKKEQDRAKDYSRAKANGKKLLKTTRA